MVVWRTLVALSTDAPSITLLVRTANSDLLYLVTITASACGVVARRARRDVMDLLLRCVAGGCRAALLFALHARHVHDVVEEHLLLIARRGRVHPRLALRVLPSCVLWRVDSQAVDDTSHFLMALARFRDCAFLVHNRDV